MPSRLRIRADSFTSSDIESLRNIANRSRDPVIHSSAITLMSSPAATTSLDISAIIAVIALLFSVYTYVQVRRSEKRATCFALYQLWFSPQMYDARTRAADICREIQKGEPAIVFSTKDQFRSDVSHIEHFIVDLHRLLKAGLVDRKLAHALFHANINSWIKRLEVTIYDPECSDSFHPGKEPIEARDDFEHKMRPVLAELVYHTRLERAIEAVQARVSNPLGKPVSSRKSVANPSK